MTSFAPQAWKIIRTRDTDSISFPMYAMAVTGPRSPDSGERGFVVQRPARMEEIRPVAAAIRT